LRNHQEKTERFGLLNHIRRQSPNYPPNCQAGCCGDDIQKRPENSQIITPRTVSQGLVDHVPITVPRDSQKDGFIGKQVRKVNYDVKDKKT